MNRRWVCPSCGSGVLAPSRPRKDDVRRYCFACSTKRGRLVERTCPAADRARGERAAKRAVTKQRKTVASKAQHTAGPYDLMAEARRFAKLPAIRDGLRRFPDITFRRSAVKSHTSGHCWYGWGSTPARIVVTIGTNPHDAPGTVLHEMVHAVLAGEHHSALFWKTLQRAAREAWPDATFNFADAPNGYKCGRAIRDGLTALHDMRDTDDDDQTIEAASA